MIFTSQTRVYKKAFLQVRAKMPLEGERSRTTSTHYSFYYSDEVGMLYERKKLKVVNAAVESVFRETGFAPTLQAPGIQEPGEDVIDTAIIDQETPRNAIVFARNLLRGIYEVEATAPYMTPPTFLFAEFDHRFEFGADLRFVAHGNEDDHMKVVIRVMGQHRVSFQFTRSDRFTMKRFAIEDRLPPLNRPGTPPLYLSFVGWLTMPRKQARWKDFVSFAIDQLKQYPNVSQLELHCAHLYAERSLSSKPPHPVRT